jgi:hypothetical protein
LTAASNILAIFLGTGNLPEQVLELNSPKAPINRNTIGCKKIEEKH